MATKTRAQLYERAHGCCEICGIWGANNAHHRRNRSQGRLDTLSNLMLLCGSGTTGCHGWVTEHPEESITEGWTIPRGDRRVPADVKVSRFDRVLGARRLVLLDDDGGIEEAA
ncbi:HNH endonuclease [Mycolicibacterium fluoranthenivorans]|uniref:HNH nuclease domain-containing protein n=1 Tax=Mycolicibacterium fluoranthenivorans TaxID=258505 RepID=A0A7X5ZG68_9MYCO|nr:HNH endonuclease signature motif containing protein [Mycolicibacterium fluoranthenivorans]MCV7359177.1 HNH endonuclease [Mycolicibacterium fluoranthenivorans]NIH98935.1 hypothetical protein [Mycolicibacterium fluoranthenivorans]